MFRSFVTIFAVIFLFSIIVLPFGFACGWFKNAAETAKKEFYPSALLKKYEGFKDLAAGIDRKRADIEVYREELLNIDKSDKDGRFYYEQRKSELLGIISIHNELCQRYNSDMSKFNYRFTNRGDMPESNAEPLPREYKPYILSLNKTK